MEEYQKFCILSDVVNEENYEEKRNKIYCQLFRKLDKKYVFDDIFNRIAILTMGWTLPIDMLNESIDEVKKALKDKDVAICHIEYIQMIGSAFIHMNEND